MSAPILLLEVSTFTGSMLVLDAVEKQAGVAIAQTEINDIDGMLLKLRGSVSDMESATEAAVEIARKFQITLQHKTLLSPTANAERGFFPADEYQALLRQPAVASFSIQQNMSQTSTKYTALGFIETQGFTASMAALDAATKAAQVELVGREKLGGGYITIVLAGDVAAVKAAVDAGIQAVESHGKLIAGHVISRPSQGVASLLETVKIPA